MLPAYLKELCLHVDLVGSRVTCNPPPTGTDQDVLCLIDDNQLDKLLQNLEQDGFQFDGSEHYANSLEEGVGFQSYRNGEINLVMTTEFDFYQRFMAATSIAKHLNLLKKDDRIALFQAVLYGNEYVSPDAIPYAIAA